MYGVDVYKLGNHSELVKCILGCNIVERIAWWVGFI